MQDRYSRMLQGMALSLSAALIAGPALAQITVAGTTPGQFSVNESGAATYFIPIQVPPGVAGMQPQLSLEYNSQGGNGLLGMGWSLSGLSAITRCPRTMAQDGVRGGVNYDMNDRFCLDGQRLMLVSGSYGVAGSEYRTEQESFSKIIANGTAGNGPASFTVQTKAGLTMEMGNTADSRIEAQGKTTIRAWALNRIQDTKTNYLTVSYTEDSVNGDYYPSRIDYTGNVSAGMASVNSVQFVYETRPDAESAYIVGSVIRGITRLKEVRAYNGTNLIKSYRMAFDLSAATRRSRLMTVQECSGIDACLSPSSLTYSPAGSVTFNSSIVVAGFGAGNGYTDSNSLPIITGDWNGDGKTDWARVHNTGILFFVATGTGFEQIANVSGLGPGNGYTDGSSYPIITGDWNGDGKTDWARAYYGGISFFISTGTGFDQVSSFAGVGPGNGYPDTNSNPIITGDWNGDGKTDWARVHNTGILFFTSTGTGFEQIANVAGFGPGNGYTDSSSYPILTGDWNGDGKTDWARFHYTGIIFYISTGTGFEQMSSFSGLGAGNGYTDSNSLPILTGDWNGDGKTDWARVHNTGILFFTSTGTGFEQIANVVGFGPGNGYTDSNSLPIITGDWNGDGKTDWARVHNTGISFFTSTGAGFEQVLSLAGFGPGNGYTDSNVYPIITGNWNGDDKTDWARLSYTTFAFHTESSPIPDLATSIFSNGIGPSVLYKPLTDTTVYMKDVSPNASVYPKIDLQYPQYVVSEVKTSNGVGGVNTVQYSYGGLKAEQGTGRGLLGFRWMKSKSVANNIESYTEFNQNWPFTGTVARNETRLTGAGNAGLLKRTLNSYAQSPGSAGATIFVYPSQSVEESWDLSGTPYPSATTSYVYGQSPQYGDPTQITVSNSEGSSKTTANEYWPADSNTWILGRLKKATVTSVKP